MEYPPIDRFIALCSGQTILDAVDVPVPDENIDYYSLQRFLSGAIIIWYADTSIYTHIKLRSIPLESKTHW